MKIVVLDGYSLNPGDLSWDGLREFGSLDIYDRSDEDQVKSRIKDAEAIFVNKVHISKEIMDANKNLKYIGELATGYNNIDVDYAKKSGIVVTNIPSYGTDSVAQHAFALLLELTTRVGHHDMEVKKGRWAKNKDWTFWDYPLTELAGKTMGIIGFGRIGQKTGQIARAFGMKVLANNPSKSQEKIDQGYKYVDLDEIFKKSDVICLHCNLTEENKGIINKENIKKMERKPILINNSRGGLVKEDDLAWALEEGLIAGAGLDVLDPEPPEIDNPLYKFDTCIITPHLARAPYESRKRLLDQAVENFRSYLQGKLINQV
ncbi:MAG: D-2-hydroxyacid dehydrogenase [Anaerococcus sp.]|nr:D-2-hydroxyacid dehydrogenase [Peptoniphilaceae bacterium]MDY3055202.1 D-2-hydroxyacid dehydrogenase [Anaerococcus sp.]